MKIHCFQHVPFEGLGNIEDWIQAHGHELSQTRFYEKASLPDLENIDWLIVMGGPMGAGDEELYPWLDGEKKMIREAMDRGQKVLGICLGAQLIASVLGARVYANPEKEIGWFPIQMTREGLDSPLFSEFDEALTVFHWHGDTFDLPVGATHLAQSEVCKHQAFSYGRQVLALQFHLDLKRENIEGLIKNCANELIAAPWIQSPEQLLGENRQLAEIRKYMWRMLDRFAAW